MTYYLLGTVHYRAGVYPDAENHLKQALGLDPRMPPARLQLAILHMEQQNWGGALTQLDAYLQENPTAADHALIQETRARVARTIERTQ
jgi:Tfp pilus assembly protein PilF